MKLEIGSSDVPSLSFRLSSTPWRRIQWRASMDADFKCSICNKKEELACHEIWEIDCYKHVMTLLGVTAICNMCHAVNHGVILREYYHNSDGFNRSTKELEKHFMAVNNVDEYVLEKEKGKARKAKLGPAES
ncbi:hypothetical protein LCGC14_0362990, partial [marine sediment metagenome]